jgi:hypothetical protein
MDGRTAIICGIGLIAVMLAPIGIRDWWQRRPGRRLWHLGCDVAVDGTATCVAVRTDRKGLMHFQSIDISRKAPTP